MKESNKKEGETTLLDNMVLYLINQTKGKYQYWQKYANIFEDRVKEIDKSKEDIAKMMMDKPDSEETKAALLFAQYDYSMHRQDLNKLLEEYVCNLLQDL